MDIMVIHFIGPGGAGKTTVAKLLSSYLEIQNYDLDEYFMQKEGNISQFIDKYGYRAYAVKIFNFIINLWIYSILMR